MYNRHSLQEKFDLVQECRSSGLSDYQWCKKNNIPNSTFYSWVKQLQKRAYAVPERAEEVALPTAHSKPDIVKLNIVEQEDFIPQPFNAHTSTPISDSCAIEVVLNNATIKISNNASPILLQSLMACLGGAVC